jgi:hypothetical protein
MTRGILKLVLVLSLFTSATLLLMAQDDKQPLLTKAVGQSTLDPRGQADDPYDQDYDQDKDRNIHITDRRIIKNGSATGTYNQDPSVVETSNGDYLLSYNVGPGQTVDYHILRRSHDRGATWTPEVDQWSATSPDPALGRAPQSGDELVSFANLTPAGLRGAAYARSQDKGYDWSGFTFFDDPASNTFAVNMFLIDQLSMYTPSEDGDGVHSSLWFSGDDGYTWTKLSTINHPADATINETAIAKVGTTTIFAISRDNANTHTWGHFSVDMGFTWGNQIDYTPQVGTLQDPELLKIKKALLLFGRNPDANELLVFASYDGGKTFTDRTVLDTYTGDAIDGGYSWALLRRDGKIFVVYYADSEGLRKPDIKSLILKWK